MTTWTPLEILLWIKIIGTLVAVALPLLFLPKPLIDRISGFSPSDVALYRLYGMALIALLVGYSSGIVTVRAGQFPLDVVIMGLVSNGGATLLMLTTGYARRMPIAPLFFGAIAVCLACALAYPAASIGS